MAEARQVDADRESLDPAVSMADLQDVVAPI
jgi:hypothetical protein